MKSKMLKSTSKRNLILQHVDLKLQSGKIYGLQGPSGSGKTMLLRLIAGLIVPSSGQVLINGKALHEKQDFPDSMGPLLEGPAFLPEYTGLKICSFWPKSKTPPRWSSSAPSRIKSPW